MSGLGQWFAKVAVENTVFHFDKAFDYQIPLEMEDSIRPGCRVLVPFGAGGKTRLGMVLALTREQAYDKLKPLRALLDEEPLLSEEFLRLVPWLKERYFCTLFEAVKLLLPVGMNYRLYRQVSLSPSFTNFDREDFSDLQWQILTRLRACRKPPELGAFLSQCGISADCQEFLDLEKRGVLTLSEEAARQIGDATVRMARAVEELPEGAKLSARQQEVYRVLREAGPVSVREVCYFTGVTPAVVTALVKKGGAQLFEQEVYRSPLEAVDLPDTPEEIRLTQEQEAAFQSLYTQYREGKGGVSLLYGVTGSGKTQVFLRLIDQVHGEGRGVIVMVPEISLTPQTIALFQKRYGQEVAVFHSGLSLGERLDEWKRIREGKASIAIGTRSAVFAPFRDLGLIVLDEEQESTYKSESSPRYHARDVAKFRCAYHKALCVLASATPSVESFYLAKRGRYTLNGLHNRYGPARLPQVEIIDMNRELEAGNTTSFSAPLARALQENAAAGRQSIVLLNRRGYHTFAACRACGEVVTCPHCSISLTYHTANHRLVCHYCGYSTPFTPECPSCHLPEVRYSGTGTQRAEEELRELLPEASILRLDTDTTMARYAYEKKLRAFARGEYDLIVGTQMVAKGLDFENVTLVGVLGADQMLYNDDFRSNERAFDLLTQVVGRSGRGKYPGRAMIQTFTPENPTFQLAAQQDYETFYENEIQFRRAMLYPPFADILVVGFLGEQEETVRQASFWFLSRLQRVASSEYAHLPMRVLRPSPAAVAKVSNRYRYKLIVKCRNTRELRELVSRLLLEFSKEKAYARVTAFADCNPDSIL